MFAYCGNNPVNGSDPCGTCFHRWDFWNDCEACGGRTIGTKWNDGVSRIAYHQSLEAEMEDELAKAQRQLISDSIQTGINRRAFHIQMQAEAQHKRDMAVILAGKYYADNPKKAIDHTFALVGAVGLYCGYLGLAGVTVPTGILATIKVTETVGTVWGTYRMIEEIFQDVYGGEIE